MMDGQSTFGKLGGRRLFGKVSFVVVIGLLALFGDREFHLFGRARVSDAWDGETKFQAIFFDVGQGDSILLRDAEGNDILVDGGHAGTAIKKLGRYIPFSDKRIELMVLTHPHADHRDGLIDVIDRYEVGRVLMTSAAWKSSHGAPLRAAIEREKIPVELVATSTHVRVGAIAAETLWPTRDSNLGSKTRESGGGDEVNDSSIVLRAVLGSRSILLTGDAGERVEEAMMDNGTPLRSDVLKVGHHGSKTSTNRKFLEAVAPDVAVIQVGVENSYGHPALQTIRRLEEAGAVIFRNDQDGDIVLLTDGEAFVVRSERCGAKPCQKE